MSYETESPHPTDESEAFTAPLGQEPAPSGERADWRLRKSMELFLRLAVTPPEVHGWENVDRIKENPDEKVIIVVSHVSGGPDLDMPVAVGTLASDLDVVVSNQSTHHHLSEEPGMYPSIKLAGGSKNFIPIGYHRDPETKQKTPDMFDPAETEAMVAALNQGRRVVVAANTPYPDEKADENTKVEAATPGNMAAYLAAITGATILPVGVWVGPATPGERRRPAEVNIGEPFKLSPSASEIAELGDIMKRRAQGTLKEGDGKRLSELVGKLRQQSSLVFDTVMRIRPHADATPALDEAERIEQIEQARHDIEAASDPDDEQA